MASTRFVQLKLTARHRLAAAPQSRSAAPAKLFAIAWRLLRIRFLNTYRPERHYMRGSGPK